MTALAVEYPTPVLARRLGVPNEMVWKIAVRLGLDQVGVRGSGTGARIWNAGEVTTIVAARMMTSRGHGGSDGTTYADYREIGQELCAAINAGLRPGFLVKFKGGAAIASDQHAALACVPAGEPYAVLCLQPLYRSLLP